MIWLLILFALIVLGPALISRLVSNLALLEVNRALEQADSVSFVPSIDSYLEPVENQLRFAVELDMTNRGAWQGLGFTLALQGQEIEALAAWRMAGFTFQEFVLRGEFARRALNYEEALSWHTWAVTFEPSVGDAWYYMGLIYENLGYTQDALTAFSNASNAQRLIDVSRSDAYYRQGVLYQIDDDLSDLDKAVLMYSSALEQDAFSSQNLKAEAHYKRGEVYNRLGGNEGKALSDFEQTVALKFDHYWAHLRLGSAQYRATKDVAIAEAEIEQAIVLWGNEAFRSRPYKILAEIYMDAGMTEKAIEAYEEVLRLDPDDQRTREVLTVLLEKD